MVRRAREWGDLQHANARQDFSTLAPASTAAADAVKQSWAALLPPFELGTTFLEEDWYGNQA